MTKARKIHVGCAVDWEGHHVKTEESPDGMFVTLEDHEAVAKELEAHLRNDVSYLLRVIGEMYLYLKYCSFCTGQVDVALKDEFRHDSGCIMREVESRFPELLDGTRNA